MRIFALILLAVAPIFSEDNLPKKETSMTIFTPPEDIQLQMSSFEVPIHEIGSAETQSIIDRMYEVASGERGEIGQKRVMVGLAAPQIGIRKRIILVDIGIGRDRAAYGNLMAFINPEITWYSEDTIEDRESCYSVDSRVSGMVPRSQEIHIRALNREGALVTQHLSGFTARIFQHELDHLNGIRFPDRVGPSGRLHWVEEHEFPEYRNGCETWGCKCPWALWEAMKSGQPHPLPTRE